MAAFRRRTQFAAPFILTIATSCGRDSERVPPPPPPPKQLSESVRVPAPPPPPPKQVSESAPPREVPAPQKEFPGTVWAVWMDLPGCKAGIDMRDIKCPPNVACNAPNPPAPVDIECPPGASGNTTQYVAMIADKTCVLVPPGCVELACAKTPTPCPLPQGQKLVHKITFAWHIEKRGEGCHVEEEDHDCPPGMDCNPPKPRMIPCPAGITEDKDVDVTQLVDGTCVIVPEGCTDLRCAVDKTPCPPP